MRTVGINAFKACCSRDTCLTPQIDPTSAASTSTLRQGHQSTVLLEDTRCDYLSETKAPPWRGRAALSDAAFLWGAHLDTSDLVAFRDAMPRGTQRGTPQKRRPLQPAQISTWPPAWGTGDAEAHRTRREGPGEEGLPRARPREVFIPGWGFWKPGVPQLTPLTSLSHFSLLHPKSHPRRLL